jgi:ligand-binding sensor domain-containing protein
VDDNGIIWIGTHGGGLAELDGTHWTVYDTSNSGLPHDLILSFAVEDDRKWIGTWFGLAEFDGANWTRYFTSNSGLPDDWVFAVAVDGRGNTWSGTWLGGLGAYREGGVLINPPPQPRRTTGRRLHP